MQEKMHTLVKSGLWVKIMQVLAVLWQDALQLNSDGDTFLWSTLSRNDFIN